jgi:hypothetical protein
MPIGSVGNVMKWIESTRVDIGRLNANNRWSLEVTEHLLESLRDDTRLIVARDFDGI